jgi:hypothetical protein
MRGHDRRPNRIGGSIPRGGREAPGSRTRSRAKGGLLEVAKALVAVVIVCGGLAWLFLWMLAPPAPRTPSNGAIAFGLAVQVGSEAEVRAHVCAEARQENEGRPFGYGDLLDEHGVEGPIREEVGYYGTGVTTDLGDSVVVFGDVPVEGGFDYETWAFEMKQDGPWWHWTEPPGREWKVCRLRPASEDEQALVEAERHGPPPTYRRTLCEEDPTDSVCPKDFTITVPETCQIPPPFDAFGRTWAYSEGAILASGEHAGQVYWVTEDMTFRSTSGALTRFHPIESAAERSETC